MKVAAGSETDPALSALERDADRFLGKYRGTVVTNEDRTHRGCLVAMVPDVLGEVPSNWALPCTPYAGAGAGLYAVPPPGATVWIEFEGGDSSRPIWVGAAWAAGTLPMREGGRPAKPTTKVLRSDFGLLVAFDDTAQTISISDALGKNLVSVKAMEQAIEVTSAAQVVLEAPRIKHGRTAWHPAVLGDELRKYLDQLVATFNAHVHPGQVAPPTGGPVTPAPPVAKMVPPAPTLNSTKNVVE